MCTEVIEQTANVCTEVKRQIECWLDISKLSALIVATHNTTSDLVMVVLSDYSKRGDFPKLNAYIYIN